MDWLSQNVFVQHLQLFREEILKTSDTQEVNICC